MSNNNGTGFWVIVALIAAMSLVAVFEAAIAIIGTVSQRLVSALRRTIAKPAMHGRRGLAA
jgi:hypothetical protein